MKQSILPAFFARGALAAMPGPLLARLLAALMRKMERRHPRLFVNLRRLPTASVRIEPTDLARQFRLTLGEAGVSLSVLEEGGKAPGEATATIRGTLGALLDLLQGRSDGDTLFFSRDLTISGDTSVIVGLRNTLDREEIDVVQELLALTGPMAKPAEAALGFLSRVAREIRSEVEKTHAKMHAEGRNKV